MKARSEKPIPASVIRRFPKYHALAQRLRQDRIEWISSQQLGQSLGLTSSTVRQDLSHLDFSGISKRGYSTEGLEKALAEVLGADRTAPMVIIGAGNLGRALAQHGEFPRKGFPICALFDSNPKLAGKKVAGLTVHAMADLREIVRRHDVDIGVLAVPAAAAQAVTDQLVDAGIRGILNLAHVHVLVPPHVAVVDARIIANLQELHYAIRFRRNGGR